MASIVRLVDEADFTTVLFDFNSPTGAENAAWGSVPTFFAVNGALDLGVPDFQATRMEPEHMPGGLTTHVREGFATVSWLQRFGQASSADNLRTGINRVATLFRRGGALEFRPHGTTESYYIFYEPSPAPVLFDGQEMGLFQALQMFDSPRGIPISLLRQPFIALSELDSDVNKLHNSTLLGQGIDTSTPLFWTYDDTGGISARSMDVASQTHQLTIATSSTRNIFSDTDTAVAASGDVFTFSFHALATSGTTARMRAVIRYLDSAGGVLGSESASGQTTLTSTAQRISVTSSAAPGSTSKVRCYMRFENTDGASNVVRLYDAQCEEAGTASRYRTGTERVWMDMGVPIGAPLTNLSGVDSGSGSGVPVGTRSYTYTFTNSTGEGLPAPASSPVTVAGSDNVVNLSSIDVGPIGTTSRKIYRRITGDTGNFKFVKTLSGNTATTTTDNLADAGLGADAPTVDTTGTPHFGRVFPIKVAGAAQTPVTCTFSAQTGASMHQVLTAARSDEGFTGNRRLVEHMNTTKIFSLFDGTMGTDTTAQTFSSGYFDQSAFVDYATAGAMLKRVRKTVSSSITCLRGSWDVFLRCGPSADDHEIQLWWGPSLLDPAPNALEKVRVDCRAGSPGEMDVPLGRITIPEEIPLSGIAFEIYAECDDGSSGTLDLDCIILVPNEEQSILGKTQGANNFVWSGSQLLTPVTNPGAGTAASSGSGYKALDDTTDNMGSPPNTGIPLTAGTWTVKFSGSVTNPSNSGVSGNLGFRIQIRNITDSADTVTRDIAPFLFEGQTFNFTDNTLSFTAVAGKSYQAQALSLDNNALSGKITNIKLFFTPTLSAAQAIHTDPDRGAVETLDASGNLLQPFFVAGPIPLRRGGGVSPAGLSVIHVGPWDLPASGAPYPKSTLSRQCDVRTRYRPMFYT